jgi:EAL domain-containing protein (putative c-di-GMP-specific phosphodiesterase class I)
MAWSAELAAGQVLARYGGEEFAVLLPGLDAEHAATCIDRLRRVTPCGQTFSAGIAAWRPDIRAEDVLGAADAALYEAKRAGRDRICIDRAAWSSDAVFRPVNLMTPQAENSKPALLTLVLQPIFEIATGRVVGHEALSRFADASDPAEGFRRAHRDGYGDLLEAETIMLALDLPGRPAGQELFVNVSASAIASPRFMPNMPDDLSGVVLELTEDMDEFDWSSFSRALDELRLRGARIAVDDLGSGVGDLVRMAAIRPDIIKIARSIMWRCDRDAGRQALITMLVTYARTQGAQVCAEGVEHEEEYAELRRLGVDLAQGFLLGRPHQHWRASRTDLGAPGSLKRLGGGAALRR